MSELVLVIEGLREVGDRLNKTPAQIEIAMQRAMNRTADSTRTRLATKIRSEVAFPGGYLSPSGGRLTVSHRASKGDLEVRLTGRDRPTSLARFAGKQKRVKVRVQRGGKAHRIPHSFLINLRNGNRGLAVRTDDGRTPPRAYKPKRMSNGLWLLYGPSVDQILYGTQSRNGGAFGDVEDWAAEKLEAEFYRLLKVDF